MTPGLSTEIRDPGRPSGSDRGLKSEDDETTELESERVAQATSRVHRPRLVDALKQPSPSWLWWFPVAIGGLYALLVLAHLHTIIEYVWTSSDSDIDAVLARMSMHSPAGTLATTGDFAHDETYAFALLTRSWPLYREIWQLAPVAFALVALSAVIYTVRAAFDRWSAALVGALLVCLGGYLGHTTAGGLTTVLSFDSHANTFTSAVLCGAILVYTVPRLERLSRRRSSVSALAIGMISGLALAGDKLYFAWGLAPLLVVTVLAAWRGPTRLVPRTLGFGLGATITAATVGVAFAAIMHGVGVRGYSHAESDLLRFTTPSGVVRNLETLALALPSLTAGSFYGKSVDLRSALEAISAALVFAALGSALWAVRRKVAQSQPRELSGGADIDPRFVHVCFWSTVLLAGMALFLVGSPDPGSTDGRYLLGPYAAIAALLPLAMWRGFGWRLAVTIAASLFVTSALIQLPSGIRELGGTFPSSRTATAIAAYAEHEDVTVGYGDYWNSIDLTWNDDFKFAVYPIRQCARRSRSLCRFEQISLSDWDLPHGQVRSLLIVDPKLVRAVRHSRSAYELAAAMKPTNLLRTLGRPIATTMIDGLKINVYSYDIATRLK